MMYAIGKVTDHTAEVKLTGARKSLPVHRCNENHFRIYEGKNDMKSLYLKSSQEVP